MLRKLLLTGAMVKFQKGSCIQVVAAVGIILIHMLAIVQFKPYRKAWHNYFSLAVYTRCLCAML